MVNIFDLFTTIQSNYGTIIKNINSINIPKKKYLGIIIIIEVEGGTDKVRGIDGHRFDTIHICNDLIKNNYLTFPIFYSDINRYLLYDLLKKPFINLILPRVNPSISDYYTPTHFIKLLNDLETKDKLILPNPKVMKLMGVKDSLVKISNTEFGDPLTYAYYNKDEWRCNFIKHLNKNPLQKRVVKQNNGSQGEGIWVLENKNRLQFLNEDSILIATEAKDNKEYIISLGDFVSKCEMYFDFKNGLIVNQKFLSRIIEGEIRLLMIGDNIVSIIKKIPIEGGISATLNSGANYIDYDPNSKEFENLVKTFTKELPIIKNKLNITNYPLPLIWTADFILDKKDNDGNDTYIIGEFNCTCVGIKTVIDKVIHLISKEIIKNII